MGPGGAAGPGGLHGLCSLNPTSGDPQEGSHFGCTPSAEHPHGARGLRGRALLPALRGGSWKTQRGCKSLTKFRFSSMFCQLSRCLLGGAEISVLQPERGDLEETRGGLGSCTLQPQAPPEPPARTHTGLASLSPLWSKRSQSRARAALPRCRHADKSPTHGTCSAAAGLGSSKKSWEQMGPDPPSPPFFVFYTLLALASGKAAMPGGQLWKASRCLPLPQFPRPLPQRPGGGI